MMHFVRVRCSTINVQVACFNESFFLLDYCSFHLRLELIADDAKLESRGCAGGG